MATVNPIEKELYSLSTEDGKAIPLDVIRPLSLLITSWGIGGFSTITIPVAWKIATFFCERGCYVQFDAPVGTTLPAENIEHLNTLIVPPNTLVASTVLPGVAKVVGYSNLVVGKLVAQQIQKWSGLALKRQISKI